MESSEFCSRNVCVKCMQHFVFYSSNFKLLTLKPQKLDFLLKITSVKLKFGSVYSFVLTTFMGRSYHRAYGDKKYD